MRDNLLALLAILMVPLLPPLFWLIVIEFILLLGALGG